LYPDHCLLSLDTKIASFQDKIKSKNVCEYLQKFITINYSDKGLTHYHYQSSASFGKQNTKCFLMQYTGIQLSKTLLFNFLVSIKIIMKFAPVDLECNVVNPEVDTQRNGRDTSLKHLHNSEATAT